MRILHTAGIVVYAASLLMLVIWEIAVNVGAYFIGPDVVNGVRHLIVVMDVAGLTRIANRDLIERSLIHESRKNV